MLMMEESEASDGDVIYRHQLPWRSESMLISDHVYIS